MVTKTTEKMFESAIDLDQSTRKQMVNVLRQEMADLFDLYSQTKQAHWNVKGSLFIALHELFDQLAEEILPLVDTMAERITALGGVARGTARMTADQTRLPEFPANTFKDIDVLKAVVERYAHVASTVREAVDVANDAGDQATTDLFIEVSRTLDKSLYFLEAHLQV